MIFLFNNTMTTQNVDMLQLRIYLLPTYQHFAFPLYDWYFLYFLFRYSQTPTSMFGLANLSIKKSVSKFPSFPYVIAKKNLPILV